MQQEYLEQTRRELKLRNYSFKTIKAYLGCLREYFGFKKFNLEKIDEENIRQFLLNKQDKNYSSQTINLYLNAIKFFYREVLKIPQKINLKFAKFSAWAVLKAAIIIMMSGIEIKREANPTISNMPPTVSKMAIS